MLGKKIILHVASCCFLWLSGSAAWATSVSPETTNLSENHTLNLEIRTKKLEKELTVLQNQIKSLKRKPRLNTQTKTSHFTHLVSSPQPVVESLSHPIFLIGTPVISSPHIGMTTAYNGSDLVVNQPYINEDLYLLQQRQSILGHNRCFQNHSWQADTPLVNISGKLEAQLSHGNTFHNFKSGSDLDLNSAEIDTEVFVNQWVTGLIAFVYDNGPKGSSPRRIENSNVFLERAFLTFGDLNISPFYGSIGQLYVPFGRYSSAMLSDPLTKIIGRTKARALTVGFMKHLNPANDLNMTAFIFRGPSKTSEDNNGLHNYGADISYAFIQPHWTLSLGTSYLRNIADAAGMQRNGESGDKVFGGFATNNTTEILQPVAGWDLRGELGIGPVHLKAEYVTALSAFAQQTLAFGPLNQLHGAKPKALSTELSYDFDFLQKPSTFAIGYSQSQEALALLIPKQRYSATFSTSIWRDTIQSIEFRHDVDYGVMDEASGGQGFSPINGTGKTANTVTFQVGLYF